MTNLNEEVVHPSKRVSKILLLTLEVILGGNYFNIEVVIGVDDFQFDGFGIGSHLGGIGRL